MHSEERNRKTTVLDVEVAKWFAICIKWRYSLFEIFIGKTDRVVRLQCKECHCIRMSQIEFKSVLNFLLP